MTTRVPPVKHGNVSRQDCISSDAKLKEGTLVALLQSCAKKKDLCRGTRLHSKILRMGLIEKSPRIGSSLINMYAKCGVLSKAQKVLDGLPFRDVVSWNALISGYTLNGLGMKAMSCFDRMRREDISPNAFTFASLLKACGNMNTIDKGKRIHDEIIEKRLLEKDIVLGNALVDMYTRCGALAKAHKVLLELPSQDVISWSTLIAGYTKQGRNKEALNCFRHMRSKGFSPNAITFTSILKIYGNTGDIYKGKQIHDEITHKDLLRKDAVLGNALIDMYARCGVLSKARQVLDELPSRDVISWNTLISGYVQHGEGEEALNCFEHMQREGISPNAVTFICFLKACGSIGSVGRGEWIHDEIVNRGFLRKDVVLGTALVDMYAKCGALSKAQKLFDELPDRNVISWSAMISGYAQQGQGEDALKCFEQMQREGLSANAIIFTSILKACGIVREIDKGKEIHDEIVHRRLLGKDIMLGNALADMYVKCGELAKAQQVIDELPERDVISWSILISGYAQHGLNEETLYSFERMQNEGLSPNSVTFACVLKACSSTGAIEKGEKIHEDIVKKDLLENDIVLGTALVDMYAKSAELAKARELLDSMPVRNVVSWSALITGYVQQGQDKEALKCYEQMQLEGLSPNAITLSCILKACGSEGAIEKGEQIHYDIAKNGWLTNDIVLGNAVVDMYAKCGALVKAQKVLDEIPVRVVVSWNALISGYAQRGKGEEALNCFERMQQDNVCPNAVTFLSVLNACSHSGLVDEGRTYFSSMTKNYGLTPDVEHYTCMVDLFCRAGHFDEAMSLINRIPSSDYPPVWGALLSACQKNGNVQLGRLAFEQVLQLDNSNTAAYICMTNIYAASGMQEDANRLNP